MTSDGLRTLAGAHGALAYGAVVALVAVLGALARRWRGAAWLGALAAVLNGATFATGALLHGPFQAKLRHRLFLMSSSLGWLFERKEHVAFGALALVLCGAVALGVSVRGAQKDDWVARDLRRASAIAMGCALLFSLFALWVSLVVARRVAF